MSEVSSEDCVRWIVMKVHPDTKIEDWKRISKHKTGHDTIREFQNRKDETMKVEVKVSINDNMSLNTRRGFTGTITPMELAGAVAHTFASHEDFEGEDSPAACNNDPIKFLSENRFYGCRATLTDEITQDLDVVVFDEENFEWESNQAFCGCERIVGFHTLPNGLSFLGITAGGDWETPLFYIIYWDGNKLRAYIPTEGNFWNTDTDTAYGSEGETDGVYDEKASARNLKKRFDVTDEHSLGDMDTTAIIDDILKNVQPVQGDFVKPKGMADIDAGKIVATKAENDKIAATPYVRPPETMNSVRVIVQGSNPDMLENGTFAERFVDVNTEAEVFLKELAELSKMNLDEQAVQRANQIMTGSLRRMVNKYVTTVSLMKQGIL